MFLISFQYETSGCMIRNAMFTHDPFSMVYINRNCSLFPQFEVLCLGQ